MHKHIPIFVRAVHCWDILMSSLPPPSPHSQIAWIFSLQVQQQHPKFSFFMQCVVIHCAGCVCHKYNNTSFVQHFVCLLFTQRWIQSLALFVFQDKHRYGQTAATSPALSCQVIMALCCQVIMLIFNPQQNGDTALWISAQETWFTICYECNSFGYRPKTWLQEWATNLHEFGYRPKTWLQEWATNSHEFGYGPKTCLQEWATNSHWTYMHPYWLTSSIGGDSEVLHDLILDWWRICIMAVIVQSCYCWG